MAEMIMRVGGKGDDGTGKGFQTDNNGILKVRLKNTSDQSDHMQDVVISAGSFRDVTLATSGNRIGIGIRLAVAGKFYLNLVSKSAAGGFTVNNSQRVIDNSVTASITGAATYDLVTGNIIVTIVNTDTTDITVKVLTVTDFK